MHTHFVFLERVVSDLSHRINDLQEQLVHERKERLAFQNIAVELQKTPKEEKVHIVNDNQNEFRLVDQKIQMLHQNASSQEKNMSKLTDIVHTNKAYLQDLLSSHKQTIEAANITIIKNYEAFQTHLTGDLNTFKIDLEDSIKAKFKETEMFNELVIKNQEETNTRILDLEKSVMSKAEQQVQDARVHFSNELELSNQMRKHEQTSIIGVINTMKQSVCAVRQEQKLQGQKLLERVNSQISQFETELKQKIKEVSRPLIVT
ncbi:hypothetical protein HDV01_002861 [Terramyces sp. JEL0728]|nr:hypothetical protein HDV01_002861 [Terramyces sp. JEL0728]